MPTFRYDEEASNEGERSSDFKMLPPGPNNPGVVIWIALNKKAIGIHGTDDLDSIGSSCWKSEERRSDIDSVAAMHSSLPAQTIKQA